MIRVTLLVLGLLAVVLAACSQGPTEPASAQWSVLDDIVGTQAPDTILPPPQYPLVVGNTWTYQGGLYGDNYDPPEIEDQIGYAINRASRVAVHDLEILPGGATAARVAEVMFGGNPLTTPPDSLVQINWMLNHKKCLYLFGWDGAAFAGATPLKESGTIRIGGHEFESIEHARAAVLGNLLGEKDPQWYDPPRDALQFYSFRAGSSWLYADSLELPFRIEKHCTGFDLVDLPTGTYLAWTITWKYTWAGEDDYDTTMETVDLVGYEGLLSRRINIIGVEGWGSGGDYLGTWDHHEYWELTGRGLVEEISFF
jgi:hypothetical protein